MDHFSVEAFSFVQEGVRVSVGRYEVSSYGNAHFGIGRVYKAVGGNIGDECTEKDIAADGFVGLAAACDGTAKREVLFAAWVKDIGL